LWLARTPRAVAGPALPGGPAAALAALLARLFERGGRITAPAVRTLLGQLHRHDAAARRADFWVAAAFRTFPELGLPAASGARQRCLGLSERSLRTARARTLCEKARALLDGSAPSVFEVEGSPVAPASALGLVPLPRGAAEACRRLREAAARAAGGRRLVWIAVAPERWDELSRRGFDGARLALAERVDVVIVPAQLPPPEAPDEWRRALWVPTGAIAGSVRFWEWFARTNAAAPHGAIARARATLASAGFAAFVADATGSAPFPERTGEVAAPRGPAACLSDRADDPGARIEELLATGRRRAALEEARRWIASAPGLRPEAWFSVSARLAADVGEDLPPWLAALEAEREVAGGRPLEARARLERIGKDAAADPETKRRARLRLAEVAVLIGETVRISRRAAAWRAEHPDAPVEETARALRLEAIGLAREGRSGCALERLDEADRAGAPDLAERVETALVRAQVHALAGSFEAEDALYAALRPEVQGAGDDRLQARFLAQEARGLLDRREYARALVRLEEAIGSARDEPAERAALAIDLAATLYHAGQADRSEEALGEAVAAAAAAGREDLARIARSNRIELWLDRCAFVPAAAEIAQLELCARAEKDRTRLLVALHQRSRLALRRGDLPAASRDNAEARRLAEETGDRLEIGELWLEEGDRCAYEGDCEGARRAWERAAQDPPDRCRTDGIARERLAELDATPDGGTLAAGADALFASDPFRAAEAVARWCGLLGRSQIAGPLRDRAAAVLRAAGAAALAERIAELSGARISEDALRELRTVVVARLGGAGVDAAPALRALGLSRLAVRDEEGRELVCLGEPGTGEEEWRRLEAGSVRFALALAPRPPADVGEAVALLLETLLYRSAAEAAPQDASEAWRTLGIVTADPAMEEPYRRLRSFAPQPVTVLVLGESGSGKEAVARSIHRLSPRASGPFVPVNIPAIPAALLESELFGHARGAFTGADRERRGLLEEAGGGTIFLDEIGDLDAALQPKLLRALQEREIRRVGENRARAIDVRVVSATSRDLARDVEAGRFREDLYYRLHVALVRLPALRERGRDALLLARHFLERAAREYGRGPLRLTPEAGAAIAAYTWPGNVRELQNAMAQAAALCEGDGLVTVALLPDAVRTARRTEAPAGDYRARVDAHRRDLITDALDRTGGNRSRAARNLGLSRQALLYLIRELKVPDRRRGSGA
jgi:DNA-binding NtrC family response regulator